MLYNFINVHCRIVLVKLNDCLFYNPVILFSDKHKCLFFSCPFDYVKIYDGYTNQADVIGTYCGKLKDFSIWSTTEALHIEFATKSGRIEPTKKPYVPYWEIEENTEVQRRGFKAEFTISDEYVTLGLYIYVAQS